MDEKKAHYIVATGIIVKDGKFLITKRADWEKAFPGKWTVPGGKLETKDYFDKKPDTNAGQWYNICENLVKREIKEETGLEIDKTNYLTSLVFVRPDNIPTLVISLYADYKSGEVKLCDALTDYKWVSVEEAKNYELIDGIYEELEMLDKKLKGENIGEWKKATKDKKIVVCSGYFDPLHVGHIECFEKAKALGDRLVVIVNNDKQAKLKKGYEFIPFKERIDIVKSLKMVDEVFPSIDEDKSVCKSLETLKPSIFAKGGDRNAGNIPEKEVCDRLGIRIVDGLGQKVQSSSDLVKKFRENSNLEK